MTDDTTPDTPADSQPEAFAPLPGDTPILEVIANVRRQCRAKHGKPAAFVAIPRKLAVAVAGDRATEVRKVILDAHLESLLDGRITVMLLALPADEPDGDPLPVIAMDMPTPMVAAWTHKLPRWVAAEGFEEHPDYAAVPFSRYLWDKGEAVRIPEMCAKLLNYCLDIAKRRPANAFQVVYHQHENARPLKMPHAGDAERLPEDPELAWAAIEAGLDERAGHIRQELDRAGMFGVEFEGDVGDDMAAKLKAAFADKFKALAEYGPHPVKAGWFALVATPMGLATGE